MSLKHIRELAIYRKSFANCGRMTIDSTWDDAEKRAGWQAESRSRMAGSRCRI